MSIYFDIIHPDCAKLETSWKLISTQIIAEATKKKRTVNKNLRESGY